MRHTPPPGAQPPCDAVDDRDECRVDLLEGLGADDPARAASRSSGGGVRSGRAAGRGCAPARAGGARTLARAARRGAPRRAQRPDRPCAGRGRGASRPSRARHPTAARPAADGGSRARRPGGTTSRPFGFATALATFARNFVRAMPTVIGSPTSSRIRSRKRAAICGGCPASRSSPRTSRNASSIESPSTSGVVSSKTAKTALLASE